MKQLPLSDSISIDREIALAGKEWDAELRLGDHGVRKYDYDLGRFTSIDPLWEKYYEWTPYHYSRNNPLSLKDDIGNIDYGFHSGALITEKNVQFYKGTSESRITISIDMIKEIIKGK